MRRRALSALDALGPPTSVPPEQRALIADYLLAQLPPRLSDQVREQLAGSAGDRAWGRVLASELAPLAAGPLPDIPWLYNSGSDSHILGFVNPGVGANGRLQAASPLPSDAARYKQLIVALETAANPHGPGKIILRGPLNLG